MAFTPLVEGSGAWGCFCCPAKLATSASKSVSIKLELVDVLSHGNIPLLTDERGDPCILSVSPLFEPALLPGLTNGLLGV